MSGPSLAIDLRSVVEMAAGSVVGSVRASGVCGAIVRGSTVEFLHRRTFPDGVLHGLRAGGWRLVVDELARAGQPIRLDALDLPHEARDLRRGMTAAALPTLAAFPVYSEGSVRGFLAAPVGAGVVALPGSGSWRLVGRAFEVVQLAAAMDVLRCALQRAEEGARPGVDGILVADGSGRVVLEEGLFRAPRHAAPFGSFGVSLRDVPGGEIVAGLAPSSCGALAWQEHLLPPVAGQGVPVALAALGLEGAEKGALRAGRVVFARDLRADVADAGADTWIFALGSRIAHGMDVIRSALSSVDALAPDGGPAHALRDIAHALSDEAAALVDVVLARSGARSAQGDGHVNRLVEEALERCRRELEAERVRVFTFLGADVPPMGGDPMTVARALRVLVDLGRASLRPGGGSLTARTWHEDGWISVTISDDGAGRRGYDEARVGMPLFEAPDRMDTDLAVIRELVERAGGRLMVESRPGIWTRCTLMVRAREEPGAAERSTRLGGSTASGSDEGLSVLVVDDNPALRSVLRRFLERRGHRVTEARDGDEGLRMVEGGQFDRLLVDIHMPRRDGPSFYEGLLGVAPDLQERTIFMTGGFMEGGTEQFIQRTGRPAIRKPFDLGDMIRTLEQA